MSNLSEYFPHLFIRVCSLFYQNECAFFFFFNFFAFIAVNSLKIKSIGELPYGVLGTAPKFGLREEIDDELPLCLRPPNNGTKENKKGRVRTGCKKRALAWTCKICCFFIYLLRSLPSPSPSSSSLLPGFINVRKRLGSEHVFSKKACHLFTRYICYSRFGPLMNYFVSLETDIWVERKKSPLF